MDPLTALRDFTVRGELERIVRSNNEFRFGSEFSFPCSAQTAFRSKQGSLYTLDTLLHFLHNHRSRHTDYLQAARSLGLSAVTFPDRKPLFDYLSGKLPSSDSIDPSADLGSAEVRVRPPHDPPVPQLEKPDFTALITASERPLKDREALLEAKGRNFHAVLSAPARREEERLRIESRQRKDGLVAKTRLVGEDEAKHGKADGVPIILVPSAFQTLITIYNVKEFLEDGVFVATEAKVKQMKGAKPECVTVQKKFSRDRDRVVAAYEVRDKPSALKPEDWERVVAVFVLGKEWQFKDWPFKDHVEIFNKIKGFFMRFEDDSIESAKTVKQWNVKIISISKNKRHQDRAAALEVWDRLEDFVRSRSHT